ncbi:response regulator transcription factor [Microbulbifer thermotolerans]|uniref:response regulator transcription factor n=1 Tax=Microbulbifer thermotolerans TaxID=252514 RepID=UPI00224B97F3|nr:response regulator transcription factor [Microbulbifer thermotolerans]MCX2778819.1 response regulator transcription factor [Microbulbifer thermotolerans]MCX2804124.1 response regulator transcription factor [Microbulbifer thermotolerans]
MSRILLVDDDTELTDLLREYLTGDGFEVTVANEGGRGLELAQSHNFDALVLDVMLPVHNGFDLLRKLRKDAGPASRSLPVLMLTAKGDTVDRIVGLEMGADDYLPKPCNPRELAARLRAVLRRGRVEPENDGTLSSGPLRLLPSEHQGYWEDQPLSLTGAEFAVLKVLVQHAGEVVSKEILTETALGRKLMPYDRSIDVHVSNIRKKLSKQGASRDLIINIRGAGYMLTESKNG